MSELALVVLSGGLDSTTALAMAVDAMAMESKVDKVVAVTFEYGQKHANEVLAAEAITAYYGVDHSIIPLPASVFAGGVLTTNEEVPDMRYSDLPDGEMSPTYVPFRNGNLLSLAAAKADSMLRSTYQDDDDPRNYNATLWAGMHAEDAQGFAYADCTPEFLGSMAAAIYIGTYGRVRLHTPFQTMEKWEIVATGLALDVPYYLTVSCYRGTAPACGRCATCHARLEAFDRCSTPDPIDYEVRNG